MFQFLLLPRSMQTNPNVIQSLVYLTMYGTLYFEARQWRRALSRLHSSNLWLVIVAIVLKICSSFVLWHQSTVLSQSHTGRFLLNFDFPPQSNVS